MIHPDHKDSPSLLPHEQVHQAQMKKVGTPTWWFRYATSRKYRQAYEVEAYKVSIAKGGSIEGCARFLSGNYFLGITYDKALELLR